MTRRYALVQLLRLGPLTRAEIIAITGWPDRAVDRTIAALCDQGRISRRNRRRAGLYQVAQ